MTAPSRAYNRPQKAAFQREDCRAGLRPRRAIGIASELSALEDANTNTRRILGTRMYHFGLAFLSRGSKVEHTCGGTSKTAKGSCRSGA